MMRPFSTALMFAVLSLTIITSADARRRPTIDSPGICMDVDGSYDCDGTICSCCYDEGPDAGCWICDAKAGETCVFDPKYRASLRDVAPLPNKLVSPKGAATTVKPLLNGRENKTK